MSDPSDAATKLRVDFRTLGFVYCFSSDAEGNVRSIFASSPNEREGFKIGDSLNLPRTDDAILRKNQAFACVHSSELLIQPTEAAISGKSFEQICETMAGSGSSKFVSMKVAR